MKITSHALTKGRLLVPIEIDPPPERDPNAENVRWIDIEDPTPEGLVEICQSLNMSAPAMDAVTSPGQRAQVAAYEDCAIVRVSYVRTLGNERIHSLTMLCFKRTLVTLHQDDLPTLEAFARNFQRERVTKRACVPSLVLHILDELIERSIELVQENRERVIQMEEDVSDEERDPTELNRISAAMKRASTRLSTACEDQFWCVQAVEASDSRALDTEGLERFHQRAAANADYGQRVLERHGRRLAEARQELQLRLHDQTDSRLRLLTVLSAIFLPLSLITGLYGMNFQRMPELTWEHGYFVTLGFMGAIAAGMLLLFKRHGWFQ